MGDEVVESGPVVAGADAGAEVTALRARLVQAELRVEAARAGMVDLDGVKMVDLGVLALDEGGGLKDGAGVMAALKAAKPYLFGRSSSSSAPLPKAEPPKAKTAMQMSEEEWRVARAELLRRR